MDPRRIDRKLRLESTEHNYEPPRKKKFPSVEDETEFVKTSKENLDVSENVYFTHPTHGYRFINFVPVFVAISQMVVCRDCKKEVHFGESRNRGLGFQITVMCDCNVRTVDSCPKINGAYEINRRIVMVMRLLSVTREGIDFFCGFMDLCQGIPKSAYHAAMKNLHMASSSVFELLTKEAVKEEKLKQPRYNSDIAVLGDATWKKTKSNTLFGVATLVGKYTGKVIDLILKSSRGFCKECDRINRCMNNELTSKEEMEKIKLWRENHEEICSANRDISKKEMEVKAVRHMFSRSAERYGVRYTVYIGHHNTHNAIMNMKPYGEDVVVTNGEDIRHAYGKMECRLRSLIKENKIKSKMLTDYLIYKLSNSYVQAIRKNCDSVAGMKNAINATFKHLCSTDENPQHDLCPIGRESWCKYRREEAKGLLNIFVHDPPLSAEVVTFLEPIYADLSKDDLLEQYLGRKSQNKKRSFNAKIWNRLVPNSHWGFKNLETTAFLDACLFNEGYVTVLRIMHILGIVIGPECERYADFQEELQPVNPQLSITDFRGNRTSDGREETDDEFY